jgi:16S rRNA (guanine966-N2)-methyltransferase
MRVIAGRFRRRHLKSLKGLALRPTSDRLRETLFDILGERIIGSRFFDIFAGTGAVGIEALSRGASDVVFIEKHSAEATLIKKNLESLDVKQGARVLSVDALKGLEILAKENTGPREARAIIFLDPPYVNAEDYHRVLSFLGSSALLEDGSLVIAEHRRKFHLPEAVGDLERVRVVRQGDATLSFYLLAKKHLSSAAGPE